MAMMVRDSAVRSSGCTEVLIIRPDLREKYISALGRLQPILLFFIVLFLGYAVGKKSILSRRRSEPWIFLKPDGCTSNNPPATARRR